jgi:hypothetical protein
MARNLVLLTPEMVARALTLMSNPYRPPEIVELQEEINGELRALKLVHSITGEIDPVRVKAIAIMQDMLAAHYSVWLASEIS